MSRWVLTAVFFLLLPIVVSDADVIHDPIIFAGAKYHHIKSSGLISEVSPDYRYKSSLGLYKVSNSKRRRAFTFVFLMNKEKSERRKAEVLKAPPERRKYMHILWTGSKRLMPEHKVVKNKYPVDVSIAQYDDGFSPGEWNLVLPNKKPKEVALAFMWSF